MTTTGLYGTWKDRVGNHIRKKIGIDLGHMRLFADSDVDLSRSEVICHDLLNFIRRNVDDTTCKVLLFLQILQVRRDCGLSFHQNLFDEIVAYLTFIAEPMRSLLNESASEIKTDNNSNKIKLKHKYVDTDIIFSFDLIIVQIDHFDKEQEKKIDSQVEEMCRLFLEKDNTEEAEEKSLEVVREIEAVKNTIVRVMLFCHLQNIRNKSGMKFDENLWMKSVKIASNIDNCLIVDELKGVLLKINFDNQEREFWSMDFSNTKVISFFRRKE